MIRVKRLSLLKLPRGQHMKTDIFGRHHILKDSAPRAWEYELEQILSTITDPTLRQKITTILSLARLGWLDQNGSSETHETVGQATSLLNNAGARQDFVNMPNASTGNHPNGPNTNSVVSPRVRTDRNVSTQPDSIVNPNAATNANVQNPEVQGYRRHYHGSLFQKGSKPSFLLKSYKCQTGMCKTDLHFIASDTSIDSDNDRFTREQLETWKNQIVGLPLTFDHEHSITSEIGVISGSDIKCQGEYCRLEAVAKLYGDHPIAQEVKRNAEAGRVLEFSIGATQPKNTVKDRNGVRHISDSNLLHISVVQSGSNRNAKLIGVQN